MRKSRSEEQIEFDKLEYVIRKREFRKGLSDTEIVEDREKSRLGMADFRSQGRVLDHNPRQVRDLDEVVLWTMFYQKGSKYKALLQKLKPDLASKIIDDVDDDKGPSSNSGDEYMNEWYEDELRDISETEDEEDEPEKSEYEKIRDKNIEELELLKKASGLFDD